MARDFDELGRTIISPGWENSEGLDPTWPGHLYTATAGNQSLYDELITSEIKLRGGKYRLMAVGTAKIGDYVEFAVVDKDDVLGMFSPLGLTVGVDVLELKKYVRKSYVSPSFLGWTEYNVGGVFEVMAGLYLRTIYVSTGLVDVDFGIEVFAYE